MQYSGYNEQEDEPEDDSEKEVCDKVQGTRITLECFHEIVFG
jgi:hypothetical protein